MSRTRIIEDPPFLDVEERDDILTAEESIAARGAVVEDPDLADRKRQLEASARTTLTPPKTQITTRLQAHDLAKLKAIALSKGLPYQALLSSIVHQYVEGALVEKRP